MKKTILSLAVITASIFASCSKDSDVATPSMPSTVDPAGGSVISLTLTGDPTSQISASRADSDTVLAEEWESELSSLTIFAFDNSDNLLVRRDLSDTEVSSKTVSFALPKSAASTTCTFYAVANIDTSSAVSKSTLLGLIDGDASDYNGSYSSVTGGAMRDDGFVMSGYTTMDVGAENTTTKVGITIKRTVAKVALELSTSDTFKASYPTATLTYKSATISKAATQSPIISSVLSTGAMTYTHTQSNATPNYLFYIYENGDLASGSRVMLEVVTTFDADGSSSTTADQSEVIYSIELSGDGAGAISRNGLYNVVATINGLVGQDCEVTISVADWETPVTQNINLGM
ncbi:MAG: FimB/Mfa2 family fimbrial subunit [Rikenellaceae bacterium]